MNKQQKELISNFLNSCNMNNFSVNKIPPDASNKVYYRIYNENLSYVLLQYDSHKNGFKNFLDINDLMSLANISVPEIIAVDKENCLALMKDFGQYNYKDVLSKNELNALIPSELRLYERATDVIISLQKQTDKFSSLPKFNEQMLIDEIMLFVEWYVKVLNDEDLSSDKQYEFINIFKELFSYLKPFSEVFVHRDFHAENLFWLNDNLGIRKVGVIDFQDACLGSPAYDLVSLFEDARRDVNDGIIDACLKKYFNELPSYNRKEFMAAYNVLAVQRNLKIIGIFTRLACKYKKPKYLSLLPRVWKNINNNIKHPILLPIKNWLEDVVPNQIKLRKLDDVTERFALQN